MHFIINNFIKTLRRYGTSSIINIVGLAMAFAAFYAIAVQVNYDLTFNRGIKDSERVHRVEITGIFLSNDEYATTLPRPTIEAVLAGLPFVEVSGTTGNPGSDTPLGFKRNNSMVDFTLGLAEISTPVIATLGIEAIEGDMQQLAEPKTIALSDSTARRLGLKVGDMVFTNRDGAPESQRTVVAIYPNMPINSSFAEYDVLTNIGDKWMDTPQNWNSEYYAKFAQNTNIDSANAMITRVFFNLQYAEMAKHPDFGSLSEEEINEYKGILSKVKLRFMPINDLHFAQDITNSISNSVSYTTVLSFIGIALLVVALALINFINFFFALVPVRIRTVNTYKIYGVPNRAIRANFVFEALGLVAIALVLAWMLVYGLQNTHIASYISAPLSVLVSGRVALLTVGVAIAVALAGSLYPAYYITSFQPAMTLDRKFGSSRAGKNLRTALLGLQFVISIGLIITASFIKLQHSYIMSFDMGFNKENLLTARVRIDIVKSAETRTAFESRLKQNPQIADVAWAEGPLVANQRMGWGRMYKERQINFECYPVSPNFLKFMGIEITEGRDFVPSDDQKENGTYIFNEAAHKEFELALDAKIIGHNGEADVVGFCKNINHRPLQYKVSALAFYVYGSEPWNLNNMLYFRTTPNANLKEVIDHARQTILDMSPSITNPADVEVKFYDEQLGAVYQRETRMATLIALFTVLSVGISLMGVFGLVLFDTRRRQREVGIRKVFGATVGEVLAMFTSQYVKMVLVCFAIATPLAHYVVKRWISQFEYQMPLHWWVFALALVVALVITVGTVLIRSYRNATENPAIATKTE